MNKKESIEAIHNLFESELLEQEFIQDIFGPSPDYTLDNDGDKVTIEIKHPRKDFLKKLETDYKSAASDFENWAGDHDYVLYNPEILSYEPFSLDEYHAASITFQVEI
jgi:hypothetical protein